MVSDTLHWNFLSVVGVSSAKYPSGTVAKVFSILTVVLFHLSIIHYFIADILHIICISYKEGVAYSLHTANSILIWYVFFTNRMKISQVLLQLYKYRSYYNVKDNSNSAFTIILTIILFVLQQIMYNTTYSATENSVKFWTFGYTISQGSMRSYIPPLVNFSRAIYYFFPVLVSYSVSATFYKCAEMLRIYNNLLRFSCLKDQTNIATLLNFFSILKMLQKLNKVLSYPLFFTITFSFHSIFASVYSSFVYGETLIHSLPALLDIVSSFSAGLTMLILYSVYSSMIPENLSEIRKTAREKINLHACDDVQIVPRKIHRYLKRIKKMMFIYLPAACFYFHVYLFYLQLEVYLLMIYLL